MHKQYIIAIVIFAFVGTAHSQLRFDYTYTQLDTTELLITYSLTFKPDTNNPGYSPTVDMYLFLGKNISLFQSKNSYTWDTIYKNIKNHDQFQALLLNPNRPFPAFHYKIYKNYPKGKISFLEHIPSSTFWYEEDLNGFDWQLKQDTNTIGGYLCQKATTTYAGRNWTAWFYTQIPFSEGPYKFSGLPGLIVNISDDEQHYVFELKSIEAPQATMGIELKEKEYLRTSKMNFFKAKDGFLNDILSRAKAAEYPTETQAAILRNVSRKNNPLELIRE